MAKGASKKITAQNATSMTLLLRGFLISNLIQILSFTPILASQRYRHSGAYKWDIFKYILSEGVAAAIGLLMRDMASKGEDLNAEGLTALLWDVVFVTWFVHVGTALVWRRLWWLYAVIPLYGIFLAYTKLIVPFVFKGQDPLAGIFASLQGGSGKTASSSKSGVAPAAAEPGLSKRQAKLQARADRGDPRIQRREVSRGG